MIGDLLGCPPVAPLILALTCTILACHLSSQWVRPYPSPSAPGDRRSVHPIKRYRVSKSRVLDFSPFSTTWKIPSFEDDRRKRQAFWTVEGKVMSGNAWGGGGGGSARACFMRGQVAVGHGTRYNRIVAIRNDGFKRTATQENDGCDHTNTNAPVPIRTP